MKYRILNWLIKVGEQQARMLPEPVTSPWI